MSSTLVRTNQMECYLISDDGEFLLLKTLDEYGETSYNLMQADDEAKYEKSQVVRAKKYDSEKLKTLKEFTAGLLLCKTSGYREFSSAFISLFFQDGTGILLASMNRELMSLDTLGKVVVFRKLDGVFVQPTIFTQVSREDNPILLYKAYEADNEALSLDDSAKYYRISNLRSSKDNLRILLNCNYDSQIGISADHLKYFEKGKQVIDRIVSKYNFKEYVFQDGRKFLMSEPLEAKDILNEWKKKDSCVKDLFLTIIEVKKFTSPISYDFSSKFSGWYFIVVPFICFMRGLAKVSGSYIIGKVVHLVQSSGYGKTRLCFELLKYEKRGIYSVYRQIGSSGFPKTTTWMSNLFTAFKESSTDKESMYICALFILEAIDHFKWHDGDIIENFNQMNTVKFDLSIPDDDLENININDDKFAELCTSIRDKFAEDERLFTCIFDECHEMLITPDNLPNGITLYRAMRRVLMELKTTPIVAVFLGTKSSLSDFVLNIKNDLSMRDLPDDPEYAFDIPLYIYTQGVDVIFNKPFLITHSEASKPDSRVIQDVWMRFGRPLWNYFDSFYKSFQMAYRKLNTEKSLLNLTAIIMRSGSSVVPQDELAHKLVLSGMATLLHVDSDGSRCWTEYVPEPMLSNAARIKITNIYNYQQAIGSYVKRLQLGSFHDSGTAGELVTRIVLLRALDLSVLKVELDSKYLNTNNFDGISYKMLLGDSTNSGETLKFLKVLGKINAIPEKDIKVSSFYTPKIGICKAKDYLLMLSGEIDLDFEKFGVSPQVLDGIVSINQFVQADNPLKMNQAYLMHCFARGCGLILPPRTKGIDLIIPILRTDNLMSCIVIQVKNYDTETFPLNRSDVMKKLTREYLDFLNFDAIGEFPAAPEDDFIRIVIQFSDINGSDNVHVNLGYIWLPFESSSPAPAPAMAQTTTLVNRGGLRLSTQAQDQAKFNCKALWFLALKKFEHLFFGNEEIITNLRIILSGQRQFLKIINFPTVKLPTQLQTTYEGANFLSNCGRPLNNFRNIVMNDASLAAGSAENKASVEELHAEIVSKLQELNLPDFSIEHKNTATLVANPNCPLLSILAAGANPDEEDAKKKRTEEWREQCGTIIKEIEEENSRYGEPCESKTEQEDNSNQGPIAKRSKINT